MRWDVATLIFISYMIGVGISRTIMRWWEERKR